MLKRLLLIAAIASVGMTGCSKKTEEEVSTTIDSATEKIGNAVDTLGAKIDRIGDDSADVANRQQVDVTLSDFKIGMPMNLKPGQTRFNISNTGKTEHNFEIEGATGDADGKEDKLMANLDPGEKTHLDVDLKAGTYNVYCPVDDHAKKGMKHKLTVK
jgi:uncharacterized cupredoxin-like copper-binding protein